VDILFKATLFSIFISNKEILLLRISFFIFLASFEFFHILNSIFVLPIAYFLQNKVNAVVQAELIKTALTLAYQSGLRIWGVTCDGAFTNFSTLKLLGCEFGDGFDSIKSWFKHPINGEQIFLHQMLVT